MSDWKEEVLNYLSWAVCLAYIGLFFSIQYSNITLFILLGCCLLSLKLSILKKSIQSSLPIQLLILFYLLHIVGVLYSQNFDNGLFVLEKKVTLLVFPVILFPAIQQLSAKDKSNLFFRLGLITILSSVVFLGIGVSKIILYQYELAFHRDYFPSIPYVFYAMYFAAGSLLLLNSLYERLQHSKVKILIMLLVTVYSLALLVIIASKTGILAYITGLAYFLYLKLSSNRLFYLSFGSALLVLALALVIYPTTLNRFIELNDNLAVLQEDKLTNQQKFTGLSLSLFFCKISASQLWEDNRLIAGVGTGDAQDYLNQVYKRHNLDHYGYMYFDPHSQWIMTLLQLGIIGFALLIAVFVSGWKKISGMMNLDFRLFAWIAFCFSLSESLLEANKGVVFIALFFCLLCKDKESNSTENTQKLSSSYIP